MPHVRWFIIGLVFLATVINYLDRLTISVLAPVITRELSLSNLEFAQVGVWFLAAYTLSQALSGRLYDRVGSKRGFTASVVVWSSAAAATAGATTVGALSACRFVLGLGEAGNWPGAAKVVAEWFPVRERAFAMAIFNSGAALGAVISRRSSCGCRCATDGRRRSSSLAASASRGSCCGCSSTIRPIAIR
jgi:ACS family hexuronate transporter-like MFS transporter